MNPEEELTVKLQKREMKRRETALSLKYERIAIKTDNPEMREKWNRLALEHAQKARLL